MRQPFRFLLAGMAILQATHLFAQTPSLHEQIDALMQAQAPLESVPLAGDAEFIRRAWLDFAGMPPSAADVRTFLADQSVDKRSTLISSLVTSPLFERRLAEALDVMLMERRANTNVSQDEWMAWLIQSVRDNKPWNQLAKELLTTDGINGSRAAARFYLDRGSESNLLTRDVGRIFFGRDLQCAQCHDHPLISDYLMLDYQGMLAIFSPGYEVKVKQGDKEIACYAERAGTDLEFESVFVKGTKHLTGARIVGGEQFVEPSYLPGDEYTVAPADQTVSIPKFSRRQQLAEQATSGQNRQFNENIANRLWTFVMGRGLVHPPDLHHSENPPSNPQLMKLLGEQFAASGFNMREFIRELALTKAYQRAWEVPESFTQDSLSAAEAAARMEAEMAAIEEARSASQAEFDTLLEQYHAAEAALIPAVTEHNAARTKYSEAGKKVAEAAKALADSQGQLTGKQSVATSVAEAAAKAQEAAAKIPDDQELAAATAKFVERSTQLQNEVAALQKAVEEKQAAHQATVDAQQAIRPEVDAALAKVQPLREAVLQIEKNLVVTREKARQARTARNQHRTELKALQLLADIKPLQDQLAAQQQVISARFQELSAAQSALTQYATTVTTSQQALISANDAMNTTAASLAGVEAEHSRRAEIAAKVSTALQTTEIALQQLPEDALLKEAAARLKERSEALSTDLSAHQQEVDAAIQLMNGAKQQVSTAKAALDVVLAEQSRLQQGQIAAESSLSSAQADLEQQQTKLRESIAGLTESLSRDAVLSDLRPLSPEQLCWSVFQVTGVYDRYRQVEIAELEKASPLTEEAKKDPAQVLAREREIEQRTYDKLKGNVGTFVTFYGAGPGQPQGDFFATADQALFAANGGSILSWVTPAGGNVTEKMINSPEPVQAAEELYLGVLSRMPTAEETADVVSYFQQRPDQKAAVTQELVWSLIASTEFRFNY